MADNVIIFPGLSRIDLPVERILTEALERGLQQVVICGFDADGEEYFASSQADGGDVLWHLERAKHRLMNVVDELAE